jgi:DNA-binding transcriptional regulator YdaS (Cro superfamily)
MTLNEYLRNRSARELARKLGVSEAYVSQLRNSVTRPSLNMARKIKDATDGAVDYVDWEKVA